MSGVNRFKLLLRSKDPLGDISRFFRGWTLHLMYNNGWQWAIRKKDIERYENRMKFVRPSCLHAGECDVCDCLLPHMFWVKDCKDKCKVK